MGIKRSFSEVSLKDEGAEAEGYQKPTYDGEHEQRKKAKMSKKKHKAREGTVNWTKKRSRDIGRRLQRDQDLPADVQKDLERELDAHQQRLRSEKDRKQRNMMIKKYHMVRFFERKKAQRLEKQLGQQLEKATDPEEIAALKANIHTAQVDVHYTKYFPFLERYVSLYPQAPDPKPDEKTKAKLALHSERPPLWTMVEEAMTKGPAALLQLQNRRPGGDLGASRGMARTQSFICCNSEGLPPKQNWSGNVDRVQKQRSKNGKIGQAGEEASAGGRKGEVSNVEEDQSLGGGFFEEM